MPVGAVTGDAGSVRRWLAADDGKADNPALAHAEVVRHDQFVGEVGFVVGPSQREPTMVSPWWSTISTGSMVT